MCKTVSLVQNCVEVVQSLFMCVCVCERARLGLECTVCLYLGPYLQPIGEKQSEYEMKGR